MTRRGQRLQSPFRARKGNVIHFGEIVIVGGQPENRNRVDAGCRRFLRKFYCGKRFVDGEHRSAEKSDLSAGHDRGRTVPKALQVRESCGDASQDLFWRSSMSATRPRREESYFRVAASSFSHSLT